MNIVTISREFGSGGRELGKKVAEILGYDYYDREIIAEIAKRQTSIATITTIKRIFFFIFCSF